MAKNGRKRSGRIGAGKGGSHSKDPQTGLWTKRAASSGKFVQLRKSGGSFKGVRREN